MSTVPTLAELEQTFKDIQKMLSETLKYGGLNAINLAANANSVVDNSAWPGGAIVADNAEAYRFALSTFIQNQSNPIIGNLLLGYLALIESEFTNGFDGWEAIFDFNNTNTRRVLARVIVFDTTPTQSGIGNPIWYRLTADKDGFEINACFLDDVTAEVISLGSEGGTEVFKVTMPRARDVFSLDVVAEPEGNGEVGSITMKNGDDIIQDSSFEIGTAADADPSALGNWIDSVGVYGTAKYEIVEDGHVISTREAQLGADTDDGKKLALMIKGNHTIQQKISNLGTLDPFHWGVYAKKQTGATGTITMTVGDNASATLPIASLSDSTFTAIVPTLDKELWPTNFGDVPFPKVKIAVSALATANVIIDGVWFHKWARYNGTFWMPRPGTTQCQVGQKNVFNDVLTTESEFQKLLLLSFGTRRTTRGVGVYWPHTVVLTPPEIASS